MTHFRYLYPGNIKSCSYWPNSNNCRKGKYGWRPDYFVVSERINNKICSSIIRHHFYGSNYCSIELYTDLDFYRKRDQHNLPPSVNLRSCIESLTYLIFAIDLLEFKDRKRQKGKIMVTLRDIYKVYSVAIKRHSDQLLIEDLRKGLQNLRFALEEESIRDFGM